MDEILSCLGVAFIALLIFLFGFYKGFEYENSEKEKTQIEKLEERLQILEGKLSCYNTH